MSHDEIQYYHLVYYREENGVAQNGDDDENNVVVVSLSIYSLLLVADKMTVSNRNKITL